MRVLVAICFRDTARSDTSDVAREPANELGRFANRVENCRVMVDAPQRHRRGGRRFREFAPDVDASTLDPASAFRDQFDFDSMGYLNFVIAQHEHLGVDIPERDYPELNGIDAAVTHLHAHLAGTTASQ